MSGQIIMSVVIGNYLRLLVALSFLFANIHSTNAGAASFVSDLRSSLTQDGYSLSSDAACPLDPHTDDSNENQATHCHCVSQIFVQSVSSLNFFDSRPDYPTAVFSIYRGPVLDGLKRPPIA